MRSRALANTAMNYFVLQNEGNLSSWTTVSFLRKTHGLVANPSSWPVRSLASPCEIWRTQWQWDRVLSVTCR